MGNGCSIKARVVPDEDPIATFSLKKEGSASGSRKQSFISLAGSNPTGSKTIKYRARSIIRRLPESIVEAKGAMTAQKPKTHWDMRMISLSIQKHAILMELSEDARDLIIDSMKFYLLPPREIVFTQGDPGVNFFVVAGGSLEVLVDGLRVSVLKPGESFGEMALLHDDVRSGTVRTLDRCTLWGVDRKTFRSSVEYVNENIYKQNRKFVDSVPLLQQLTSAQKESLLAVINVHRFLPKKPIFSEGEFGDLLYIISEGTVTVSIQGVEKRRLSPGDYFGEMALLNNAPRSATIIAADAVTVLCIGREHLTQVLGDSLQRIIYHNLQRQILDNSTVFQFLTSKQKDTLVAHMSVDIFEPGSEVLPVDTLIGSEIFLILQGQLKMRTGELFAEKMHCLGDEEMLNEKPNPLNQPLFAADKVEISRLGKKEIEGALGGPVKSILSANDLTTLLQSITAFRSLLIEHTVSLVDCLKTVEYAAGTVLLEDNSQTESLYIIKKGHVEVLRRGEVEKMLTERDYFEDKPFLLDDFTRLAYRAKGNVVCWVLSRTDLMTAIGQNTFKSLQSRYYLYDTSIKLNELKIVRPFLRENLGFTYVSVHKYTQNLYLLRPISKAKLEISDIRLTLQAEFNILKDLDHRMVVKFVRSFIDEKRIFLLSELIQGQNLVEAMRVLGLLDPEPARFYICGLYSILEYLHGRNVVYRDLTPEKVMVDVEGYPKLVDFAQAKVIDGRTFTIVGTPHYQAPEVLLGKGYGFPADYWSLGVILFELMSGRLPFGDEESNPVAIYNAVTRDKLQFPSFFTADSIECLSLMLDRNPAVRASNGVRRFRSLAWTRSFDWEQLRARTLVPPLLPKVADYKGDVEAVLRNPETLEFAIHAQEPETEHLTTRAWNWDSHFETY